jgi:hypothetical protein
MQATAPQPRLTSLTTEGVFAKRPSLTVDRQLVAPVALAAGAISNRPAQRAAAITGDLVRLTLPPFDASFDDEGARRRLPPLSGTD